MIYTLDERGKMVSGGNPDPYDDSQVMTACHYASKKLDEDDPSPRRVFLFHENNLSISPYVAFSMS